MFFVHIDSDVDFLYRITDAHTYLFQQRCCVSVGSFLFLILSKRSLKHSRGKKSLGKNYSSAAGWGLGRLAPVCTDTLFRFAHPRKPTIITRRCQFRENFERMSSQVRPPSAETSIPGAERPLLLKIFSPET